MTEDNYDLILVLDFGAQYAQLIARRVRELKVYSEIVPYSISPEEIRKRKPKGIILSGGPTSVYVKNALNCDPKIFKLKIPILGICYGMQLMTKELHGVVEKTDKSEFGKTKLFARQDSVLFNGLPRKQSVWMSHRDSIIKAPPGFEVTGKTESTSVAAFEERERGFYGVQFHPEVVHTPNGMDILKNFLFEGCRSLPTWTKVSIIENSIKKIKETIGNEKAICALSGGVDSSVAALLVNKAIGDKLTCVFVDHGLLRKDEGFQVERTFKEHFHLNLKYIKAQKIFLKKLKNVIDPEKKRKIIGEEFIRVFEREADKFGEAKVLVQGTLYPDVIESGTKEAARIKTHHNVG
ncbi:MAG: glutamine-hydrolyzing GMP synthase, partial [Actinomycetia bacterium]|nr:glutamine-hydrolyzing GMP synthase [Actinomycetes bacterium]